MAREPYEISIWKDTLIPAVYESGNLVQEAYFKEEKLVVIGSDTMTSTCRAFEPRLVENVNGTNILTFKMFYICTDEQTGKKFDNPYVKLLVNERKVKVKWKNKWYNLVVKNIQEDSSGKSITYTCKDQFINELSKTGFNLEFSNDLKNNQGTAYKLGQDVLEDSGWEMAPSDTIQQTTEEALYTATTTRTIGAINENTGSSTSISSGETVLIYYSCIANNVQVVQFLWLNGYTTEWPREQNSSLIIGVDSYNFDRTTHNISYYFNVGQVTSGYRGTRKVKSQESIFDPKLQRYVDIYTDSNNNEVYGYKSIEYKDPTYVNNLLINYNNFSNLNGWYQNNGSLTYSLYPLFNSTSDVTTYTASSYLRIAAPYTGHSVSKIFNSGLYESSSFIPKGLQKGEEYIFRFCMRANDSASASPQPKAEWIEDAGCLDIQIFKYNSSKTPSGSNYLSTGTQYGDVYIDSDGNKWISKKYTVNTSFSKSDISNLSLGFFLEVHAPSSLSGSDYYYYWIKEIQFFPLIKDSDGNVMNPGEMAHQSVATSYYHYYNPNQQAEGDDIKYLYIGTTDLSGTYTPKYNTNFEKIRSITAKNSNRFNLLQTIAETFECWCKFTIENNPTTGELIYYNVADSGSPIKYMPKKTVAFKKSITEPGRDNLGYGFIYGIDLKSISRTIQSDQIVTKTIVSPNSNEFGINGFCTIARSNENYSKENFILNFDYYINCNLLDGGEINKDLYIPNPGIGYYPNLRSRNEEYDAITDELINKRLEKTKLESQKTVYDNYLSSTENEEVNLQNKIIKLAGVNDWSQVNTFIRNNPSMSEIDTALNAWRNCVNNKQAYAAILSGIRSSLSTIASTITTLESQQETLLNEIKGLHYKFYQKYAGFIQEGSWIDESYMDDTLYYLDAQGVAYTSSRPQVSYNISVIRISSLEEFKNKVFKLGDISFVQDTEFFGYISGTSTPYKEKVFLSEMTSNFDSPEQDTFKVQNYKTQFEDLFQRITATTQNLQFVSGDYDKAAAIIDSTGTIKSDALQNAFTASANLVYSATNEQIVQDNTGITFTDAKNPNLKTKITSGGVFITTDGGATWKNAINANGIATEHLSAGLIDTNRITLYDGHYEAFRWDSSGINAYDTIQDGGTVGVNFSKAVRFDRFGIYGINGLTTEAQLYKPEDEDQIWNEAQFGMTWKGFFLHNVDGNSMVQISSLDDIRIITKNNSNDDWDDAIERIKIGKLSENQSGNVYGLRLKDAAGATTLETTNDGTLWLRDVLHISSTQNINNYNESNIYNIRIGKLPQVEVNNTNQAIIYEVVSDIDYDEDNERYQILIKKNLDKRAINGYTLTTSIPADWNTNWKDYYVEINNNYFDLGTIEQTRPAWESDTYYKPEGGYNKRTIDVNHKFIVWEDGSLYANDGYFQGEINATGGKFKGEIYATNGEFSGTITGDAVISEEAHFGSLSVGDLAAAGYELVMTSSNGMVFTSGVVNTTLTATLYKGGQAVNISNLTSPVYVWKKDSVTIPTPSLNPNQVVISNASLPSGTFNYECTLTFTTEDGKQRSYTTFISLAGLLVDSKTLYTWIKYSDENPPSSSSHVWDNPVEDNVEATYIGFAYNKESPEASHTPSDYTWSEFRGPQGASGKNITNTTVQYAVSTNGQVAPESGWQNTVPVVPSGQYLWTKTTITYSEGNPSIIYTVSRFGKDSDAIRVSTDFESIAKYYNKNNELDISPQTLRIWLEEKDSNRDYQVVTIDNITLQPFPLENNSVNIFTDLESLTTTIGGQSQTLYSQIVNVTNNIYSIDLIKLNQLEVNEIDSSAYTRLNNIRDQFLKVNLYFLFTITKDNEKYQKLIYIYNGNSFEMARFAVTAAKIQGSVDDTTFTFTEAGLEVKNGGFKIVEEKDQYIETTDSAPQAGKEYYYIDNNNQYVKFTGSSFSSGVIYYEKITSQDLFFYDPTLQRLIMKGMIYADGGEFTGSIHALDGEFKGQVNAQSGEIGGFIITDKSLISKHELTNGVPYYYPTTDTEKQSDKTYYYLDGNVYIEFEETNFHVGTTYYECLKSSIQLLGEDGQIIAEDIILGKKAVIRDYIQLGDTIHGQAWIYNPSSQDAQLDNDAYFFKVGSGNVVSLTAKGLFKAGRIEIDGINSTITGKQTDNTYIGWPDFSITPEKAYFPNVEISGKITASVFEVNRIQAVGGSMLFKPAFKIIQSRDQYVNCGSAGNSDEVAGKPYSDWIYYKKDSDNNYIVCTDEDYRYDNDVKYFDGWTGSQYNIQYYRGALEIWIECEEELFQQYMGGSYSSPTETGEKTLNDITSYCMIIDNLGQIIRSPFIPSEGVSSHGQCYLYFNKNQSFDTTPTSLIIMGNNESLVIGINASDSNSYYMRSRGLTMSTFHYDDVDPAPDLFLGDFENQGLLGGGAPLHGFGLYANHVILKGSLTTESVDSSTTYAGINTINSVAATKFAEYGLTDTSKIIFWAGASNVNDVANAPFQVTRDGSIYAQNGVFTGSLITDSEIHGASIYTAKIYGTGSGENEGGLIIYSTSETDHSNVGIVFKDVQPANIDQVDLMNTTRQEIITVFKILSDGLYYVNNNNNIQFIKIDKNNGVTFTGHDVKVDYNLTVRNSFIYYPMANENETIGFGYGEYISGYRYDLCYLDGTTLKSWISLNRGGDIVLGISGNTSKFRIGTDSSNFYVDEVSLQKNFMLGNQTNSNIGNLRYEQSNTSNQVGYNLYVG